MDEAVYDYRLPTPALRAYVRQFQIVGCRFPDAMGSLPVKPYWPRAENTLAFYPRDREIQQQGFGGVMIRKPSSVLNGQYVVVTNRYVGRDFMVFQVQFQPGALFRLTGIPGQDLANQFIDAEVVFGAEITRVNERLSSCSHYQEMIPLVEAFLLTLISRAQRVPDRPIDRIAQLLLQNPDVSAISTLADLACLSQRQFYRMFVTREGVSPKTFARIARFEKAMNLRNRFPDLDWLSIAVQLGYHDYQHLVRDFKEFTGVTPNAFLQYEKNAPERKFGRVEVT